MLGIATASAAPTMAATTVYGSAQLKYTVNATAAVSIAVNYDPTTGSIKNATAGSILASAAGNCSAAVAEGANATLTFGGITPPGAGYTGCYYQNAISVGVQSNDSSGIDVYEYLDVAPAGRGGRRGLLHDRGPAGPRPPPRPGQRPTSRRPLAHAGPRGPPR